MEVLYKVEFLFNNQHPMCSREVINKLCERASRARRTRASAREYIYVSVLSRNFDAFALMPLKFSIVEW